MENFLYMQLLQMLLSSRIIINQLAVRHLGLFTQRCNGHCESKYKILDLTKEQVEILIVLSNETSRIFIAISL